MVCRYCHVLLVTQTKLGTVEEEVTQGCGYQDVGSLGTIEETRC